MKSSSVHSSQFRNNAVVYLFLWPVHIYYCCYFVLRTEHSFFSHMLNKFTAPWSSIDPAMFHIIVCVQGEHHTNHPMCTKELKTALPCEQGLVAYLASSFTSSTQQRLLRPLLRRRRVGRVRTVQAAMEAGVSSCPWLIDDRMVACRLDNPLLLP